MRTLTKLTLIFFGLCLALILSEVTLRALGFRFQLFPERIEFGYPDPKAFQDVFIPDPDLLYVENTYPAHLEALKKAAPKLIFLGDSCTATGTYPEKLTELIHAQMSDFSTSNAAKVGTAGWSSYSGIQQFKRDIIPLQPRIATFYFGWNDHWIGFGLSDAESVLISQFRIFGWQEHSRLVQLFLKVYASLSRSDDGVIRRVPLSSYHQNLVDFVQTARKHNIVPVLLTAPSSHTRGKEPRYLLERHIKTLEELIPMHAAYNDAVRTVARELSAPLCDLALEFSTFSRAELTDRYFTRDGIHLQDAGNAKISELLFKCFVQYDLLSRLES
jgi:lysophospholipase L1-like esterase